MIVLQHAVEVLDTDTVDELSERILVEEHIAYVEGIRRVLSGEFEVRERRFARKAVG